MTTNPFPPIPIFPTDQADLWSVLKTAIAYHPFNLIAIIIFALAITHTLLAHQIAHFAHQLEKSWDKKNPTQKGKAKYSFLIEFLHFIGEVEIIFAIWAVPLIIVISYFWDLQTAVSYLNGLHYREAIFVIVIMIIASTKPILEFVEYCLRFIPKLFKENVAAWWLTILTFCPILGSFITEPAAMILAALLLKQQFYQYKPSKKLAYASIGLLFVHISIGGVLTNFAAPPVLMVAHKWGWSNSFMFFNFGIKSILSIVISNLIYFFIFCKELKALNRKKEGIKPPEHKLSVPLWVILFHILLLFGVVYFEKYSIILVGLLFLCVAFHRATKPYQGALHLRGPVLVGSFLAGLIIHGSLQGWWIEPIIKSLQPVPLMFASTVLTSFNDNALITYLASLIHNLSPALKYAVVSGAVAGGGLTVIANAPNPAGQFILKDHFEDGVAPLSLFLAALLPTCVILGITVIRMFFM